MWKKFISGILCAGMLFSLIPASVMAADEQSPAWISVSADENLSVSYRLDQEGEWTAFDSDGVLVMPDLDEHTVSVRVEEQEGFCLFSGRFDMYIPDEGQESGILDPGSIEQICSDEGLELYLPAGSMISLLMESASDDLEGFMEIHYNMNDGGRLYMDDQLVFDGQRIRFSGDEETGEFTSYTFACDLPEGLDSIYKVMVYSMADDEAYEAEIGDDNSVTVTPVNNAPFALVYYWSQEEWEYDEYRSDLNDQFVMELGAWGNGCIHFDEELPDDCRTFFNKDIPKYSAAVDSVELILDGPVAFISIDGTEYSLEDALNNGIERGSFELNEDGTYTLTVDTSDMPSEWTATVYIDVDFGGSCEEGGFFTDYDAEVFVLQGAYDDGEVFEIRQGDYFFEEGHESLTLSFVPVDEDWACEETFIFRTEDEMFSLSTDQSVTITDFEKWYDIRQMYGMPVDGSYKINYEQWRGNIFSGNETVDDNCIYEFEPGEEIVWNCDEDIYKVIAGPNDISYEEYEELEYDSANRSFSYIPKDDKAFNIRVFYTEEEYEYEMCFCEEGHFMIECFADGEGTAWFDVDNVKAYMHNARAVLETGTSSVTLVMKPDEGQKLVSVWLQDDETYSLEEYPELFEYDEESGCYYFEIDTSEFEDWDFGFMSANFTRTDDFRNFLELHYNPDDNAMVYVNDIEAYDGERFDYRADEETGEYPEYTISYDLPEGVESACKIMVFYLGEDRSYEVEPVNNTFTITPDSESPISVQFYWTQEQWDFDQFIWQDDDSFCVVAGCFGDGSVCMSEYGFVESADFFDRTAYRYQAGTDTVKMYLEGELEGFWIDGTYYSAEDNIEGDDGSFSLTKNDEDSYVLALNTENLPFFGQKSVNVDVNFSGSEDDTKPGFYLQWDPSSADIYYVCSDDSTGKNPEDFVEYRDGNGDIIFTVDMKEDCSDGLIGAVVLKEGGFHFIPVADFTDGKSFTLTAEELEGSVCDIYIITHPTPFAGQYRIEYYDGEGDTVVCGNDTVESGEIRSIPEDGEKLTLIPAENHGRPYYIDRSCTFGGDYEDLTDSVTETGEGKYELNINNRGNAGDELYICWTQEEYDFYYTSVDESEYSVLISCSDGGNVDIPEGQEGIKQILRWSNMIKLIMDSDTTDISFTAIPEEDMCCAEYTEYNSSCNVDENGVITWSGLNYGSSIDIEFAEHDYREDPDDKYLVSEADCCNEAVYCKSCSMCGCSDEEQTFKYGEADPDNHGSYETYVEGKTEATEISDGYTGDVKCSGCDAVITKGTVIPKIDHWKSNKTGSWYQNDDGTYFKSTWKQLNDENGDGPFWYYFNPGGYRVTGWNKLGGKYYYFDEMGRMYTGFCELGGKTYYLDENSGAMATGWLKYDGEWYYFETSGAMSTGWKQLGSKWYYFMSDGVMATGWQDINDKEYCFASSGAMLTGWQEIDGDWYYFASSGALSKGWTKVGTKWYYLDPVSGEMYTGFCTIDGAVYYLASSGAMLTGWQEIDGYWYYFASSGAEITSAWAGDYYLDSEGHMVTYSYVRNGSKYYWINAKGKYTGTYSESDTEGYTVYDQETGMII